MRCLLVCYVLRVPVGAHTGKKPSYYLVWMLRCLPPKFSGIHVSGRQFQQEFQEFQEYELHAVELGSFHPILSASPKLLNFLYFIYFY